MFDKPFGIGKKQRAEHPHATQQKGNGMSGDSKNQKNREVPVPMTPERSNMTPSVQEQLAEMRKQQQLQTQAMMGMLKELGSNMAKMKEALDKKPDSEELKATLRVVEGRFNELEKDLTDAFNGVGTAIGNAQGEIENRVVQQTNRLWDGIDKLTAQVEDRTANRLAAIKKEIENDGGETREVIRSKFGH